MATYPVSLPDQWWDDANEAVLEFIAEKAQVDLKSFGNRWIQPNFLGRVKDGDYKVTVAKGSDFYILTYRLEDGVFVEAYVLTKSNKAGDVEIPI